MAKPMRRTIRFQNAGEALREIEKLVAADRAGTLSHTGNWDLGKTLGHVATWCEFAFDGYPDVTRVALPMRLVLRGMRNTILNRGMMTGIKVGKVPGGTLGLEDITTEAGLQRFQPVFDRINSECPTAINPIFGRLTHEQWIALQLRHLELHLSFQHPTPPSDAAK